MGGCSSIFNLRIWNLRAEWYKWRSVFELNAWCSLDGKGTPKMAQQEIVKFSLASLCTKELIPSIGILMLVYHNPHIFGPKKQPGFCFQGLTLDIPENHCAKGGLWVQRYCDVPRDHWKILESDGLALEISWSISDVHCCIWFYVFSAIFSNPKVGYYVQIQSFLSQLSLPNGNTTSRKMVICHSRKM